MKKIIALSIGLIYGTAFAAQEPIEKETPKDLVKTEQTVSAPSTPTEKIQEECKQPVKPIIKIKKKKTPKVVATEPITKSEDSVLVVTDYYHIPKGNDESSIDWQNKITYNDVDISIEQSGDNPISISLIDKRVNQLLDPHYLKQMENFKSDVNITELKIDLTAATTLTHNFNGTPKKINFSANHESGACSAVFVTYQLKTQPEEETFVKFFDRSGNITNYLPQECSLPEDNKETTFYTPAGNIVDIGYNRKIMEDNKIGLTVHFTRDGREFFPNLPFTYVISKKADKIHYLIPTYNSKNPYFGLTYNQPLPPGDYFLLLGMKMDGKTDFVKTSFATR